MQDILLFGTGILVGAMNSIAGGGMLIGFPVLIAAGMPALAANVTTNIVVIPGQIGAIIGYRKYLKKIPNSYLLLVIPCIIGAAIGSSILKHTSSSRFNELIPGLLMVAVILFALQPFLHSHLHRHLLGKAKGSSTLSLIGLALLPMSIYGGYFGVGFGFVILAFLGFTKMHDIHQINALKNIATLFIALTSVFVLFRTGLIGWEYGLSMAAGCALGGYYGSRLAQRFSSHAIRIVVIIIGFAAVTYLAFRTY
jgi:uncharacterized membrane protein YfcA